jgi:hypothetical protein
MSGKDKKIKQKIKIMEQEKRRSSSVSVVQDKLIHFESWFHMRKDAIPKQHLKEILVADFKARGVGNEATMAQFDNALRLYGIKLDNLES